MRKRNESWREGGMRKEKEREDPAKIENKDELYKRNLCQYKL